MTCLCSNVVFFQELLVPVNTSTFLVEVLPLLKDIQKGLAVSDDDIEQEIDTIKVLFQKKFLKGLKDNYNKD